MTDLDELEALRNSFLRLLVKLDASEGSSKLKAFVGREEGVRPIAHFSEPGVGRFELL